MTETQAKSGAAGASTDPGRGGGRADNGSGTPATGRAAVGRAAVPAEAASPKFTRAPGMTPPPEQPAEGASGAPGATTPGRRAPALPGPPGHPVPACRLRRVVRAGSPVAVAAPPATGKAQVSAPPAGPATAAGDPAVRVPPARCPRARPGGDRDEFGAHGRRSGWPRGGGCGTRRRCRRFRGRCRPGHRGRAGGPRHRRVRPAPRPAPGPAEPQADRPVVGDEVLVRRVARAVRRRHRRDLGALPGARRDGRLRQRQQQPGRPGQRQRRQRRARFKITAKGVIGTSALLGAVNVVLFTALATLGRVRLQRLRRPGRRRRADARRAGLSKSRHREWRGALDVAHRGARGIRFGRSVGACGNVARVARGL